MNFYIKQNYHGMIFRHILSEKNDVKLHCHPCYELIYILQGEGNYTIEGSEYPIHPYALFFTRPMEYHAIHLTPGCAYERIVLQFDEEILPPAARACEALSPLARNYYPINARESNTANAISLLTAVDEFCRAGDRTVHDPQNEAFLSATLTQILLLLSREKEEKLLQKREGTVFRVLEYLNTHLCEDVSLERLEEEFFISKYHLCRMFRRQMGVSVFHYFNLKRMALAQQLLRSGVNATEVARQLGFGEYSTFWRTYRKYTGHAPTKE